MSKTNESNAIGGKKPTKPQAKKKKKKCSKGSVPITWYQCLSEAFQRVCTSTSHCQSMDVTPPNLTQFDPKAKSNSKHGFRVDRYKGMCGVFLSLPSSSSPCKNTHKAELSKDNSQIFQNNTPNVCQPSRHNTMPPSKQRAKRTFRALPYRSSQINHCFNR